MIKGGNSNKLTEINSLKEKVLYIIYRQTYFLQMQIIFNQLNFIQNA